MSKCLIVYYSQSGSTKTITEAVARGLRAQAHDVDLHDLKDGPAPDPAKYDLLGIGCPAHYYRPAIIVSDYLATLPQLSGKPVFTFVLHAAYLGDTGNLVRRELERRGGRELGYARYRGEGHFLGYLKHGYQLSPHSPKPDAIAEAERFGRDVAERLAGKPHARADYDSPTPFIYRLERFLSNRLFIRHLYSRLFGVNESKCAACGLCRSRCPTRNIREDDQGRPVWGRDCILCFACEAKCPNEAIASPVTWFMFWPFMVYNTRTAAADPAIEHARVTHRRGRTTVV
jgi:flavodoxin/NAD-dependent dihydropyrimidine dehydrogenase PreA subunit